MLSESEYQVLKNLEESLWKSETRFDPAHQEKIFAVDFFEFGRSGRVYTRAQVMQSDKQPIEAALPLKNFKISSLDQNNVLITYVSEVRSENLIEKANRCSVWSRLSSGWQLRFHQGTPTCD
jgi:hypothetical protein